jgi:hypothetical protein
MLTFDPSWSRVFDLAVCAAILWFMVTLVRLRPFRAVGLVPLLVVGVLLAGPILYFGRMVSLVASLVVVPILAITSYSDTEQPLPLKYKVLLSAARILVFLLVVVCLLRPRLRFQDVEKIRACAVVLADVSTSMESQDCPPDETRYAAVEAILRENADRLDEIREACDYRFAAFADSFERRDDLPGRPTGSRTDLANAFVKAGADLKGAKTAGLILLTDGRHNGVGDPLAAARRLGVRVFPVCLGAETGSESFADSSIQNVDCPERVFVKNIATVTIRVAYEGPETDRRVKVRLTAHDQSKDESGERPVGRVYGPKVIPLPKPGTTTDVTFDYIPETEGLKRLVAHVEPAENDPNLRNNTREIFVRASESALKVWFVEGEVRWEYKFLRRAVAGAANIKLLCVNAFLAAEADRARLLPATDKDWAEMSLVILGDIPADRFSRGQLDRLKKFVADGGALLMLGGFNTLGPGGYGSTPIDDILPVDVKEADPQTLEPFQVVPTRDGLEHNILAFGPSDETAKIWASLPPLSGYTRLSGVKPAARVLVQSPADDPILVVQDYEKGRTAVFAADTTWRWIFNKGKFARYHKAFWRQLVQWLTKSGYGGPGGGVWCETDRLRYLTGDTPILTVRASGEKVRDAPIRAVVSGPGVSLDMTIGVGAGQYVLGLPKPVETSGEYNVTVTATPPVSDRPEDDKKNRSLEAKTRFVVQQIDIESENPGADPSLLRQIARETDGRFFERRDAANAFDEILSNTSEANIERSVYRRLWDNWVLYVAFGGLLCAEWIGRKRRGLA